MSEDRLVRGVSKDGVKVMAVVSTKLCDDAFRIHQTFPTATAALGRTLTMASMMGAGLKGENESITIQMKGDGPLEGIVAVTDASAMVKGYVYHPQIDVPLRVDGKLDVGAAIGYGTLTVIRDLGLKEPYVGQVPLLTGEIAEDFVNYYAVSEQSPSAIGLGVLVAPDGHVRAAGGFMVSLLPDASEEVIEKLEGELAKARSVSAMVDEGMTPEEMIESLLPGMDIEIIDKRPVGYRCDCSEERVARALVSLGEKELTEMIQDPGHAELTCHFCTKQYHFDKGALIQLLASATSEKRR